MSEPENSQGTASALLELANAIRETMVAAKPAEGEWMTLDQAAGWLGLHEQTIRETIAADNPAWAKRFGRSIRISRTLLMQAPPIEKKRKAKR